MKIWLTGGKLGPSDRNTISVDQKMAEVTGKHTRYPSMEIAINQDSLAWTADGVNLPPLRRCSEIFDSLFGNPPEARPPSASPCAPKAVSSTPTSPKCAGSSKGWGPPTKAAWSSI
jgi:hypothetical protein